MAEQEYQRLARPSNTSGLMGLSTRSSLWLAKDHILRVDSTGYSERYKRFYFRDIQSITIQVTLRRTYWNLFLGASSGLLILGGIPYSISQKFGPGEWIAGGVLAMLFVIPLIVNNILGTTCTCKVKTAVQIEPLPMRRLRKARKVLARVQPLVLAAQEKLQASQGVPAGETGFSGTGLVEGETVLSSTFPVSSSGATASSSAGASAEMPAADSAVNSTLAGNTPVVEDSASSAPNNP